MNQIQHPVIEVAVGILLRMDHHFLFTQRPVNKTYAGYWEFPGGKIEPGESIKQGLQRELLEEIGINILDCKLWKSLDYQYEHAYVRLHFHKITQWIGEPSGQEGQCLSWQTLPTLLSPLLPATLPILKQLYREIS